MIVVVSPHRDDAAFSVGFAVQTWLEQGHRVSVLNCFTQSEYAPYTDVETVHANDRVSYVSALRKREDLAWNKLLGHRLSFHDLDLLDAPLRLGCSVDEVLLRELRPGDRAIARVEGALEKLARNAPELALVVPFAIGEHIDHQIVHHAVCNVAQRQALALAFYEDLPYAAREGAVDPASLAGEGLEPVFVSEPVEDTERRVREKARMAECYDSQLDSAAAALIANFCTRYGGRERLWANAPWRNALPPVAGAAAS